jgi:hypothetical protein
VIAESVLAKHQLLILNRSRRRAPNLRTLDRLIAGFCSLWISPTRLCRVAIAFRPSTFLNFHRAMVQRKCRLLFSPKQRIKPGPKGPTADLAAATTAVPTYPSKARISIGVALGEEWVAVAHEPPAVMTSALPPWPYESRCWRYLAISSGGTVRLITAKTIALLRKASLEYCGSKAIAKYLVKMDQTKTGSAC